MTQAEAQQYWLARIERADRLLRALDTLPDDTADALWAEQVNGALPTEPASTRRAALHLAGTLADDPITANTPIPDIYREAARLGTLLRTA